MAGRVLRSSNGRFAGSTKGWMAGVRKGKGQILRGDARRKSDLGGSQGYPSNPHTIGMGHGLAKRPGVQGRVNVTLGARMTNADKRYNINRSIGRLEAKMIRGNMTPAEKAKIVNGIKIRKSAIRKIRG